MVKRKKIAAIYLPYNIFTIMMPNNILTIKIIFLYIFGNKLAFMHIGADLLFNKANTLGFHLAITPAYNNFHS